MARSGRFFQFPALLGNDYTAVLSFIRRQIQHVQQHGLRVLYPKTVALARVIAKWLLNILLLPVIVPILFAVRLLYPIIPIRFGRLRGERLGHLVLEPEFYLCERDLGKQNLRARDFFYFTQPPCNLQVSRMLRRLIIISPLIRPLDEINKWLPGGRRHVVPLLRSSSHEDDGLLDATEPHLSFTSKERLYGDVALRNLGISGDAPFVCFVARESSYLASRFVQDFSYHDYRDSNIKNYLDAADELTKRGNYAIRMGAVVEKALDTVNPMVIDYAWKGRTDFLDVYLFSKSRFLISSNSGSCAVAMAFRRPIAFVNVAPLLALDNTVPLKHVLFIPKKYWLSSEKRFMTFREIFAARAHRLYLSSQYKQLGIELVENTSEEIKALAMEMDDLLNGIWRGSGVDTELRDRFTAILKEMAPHGVRLPCIGADFLRQNSQLLD